MIALVLSSLIGLLGLGALAVVPLTTRREFRHHSDHRAKGGPR